MRHLTKIFKAQSAEWKEMRNTKLTGTELGSLLGVDIKGINSVIKAKYEESVFFQNVHTTIGEILEPAVIKVFAHHTGMRAEPAALEGKVKMVLLEDTCLASSLDAMVNDKIPLECKTTSQSQLSEWGEDTNPKYVLQAYLQMMGLASDIGYICAVAPIYDGLYSKIWEIKRSAHLDQIILTEADRFQRDVFINGYREFDRNKSIKQEVLSLCKTVSELMVENILQKPARKVKDV